MVVINLLSNLFFYENKEMCVNILHKNINSRWSTYDIFDTLSLSYKYRSRYYQLH